MSLMSLSQLPINTLKIDRSFISQIQAEGEQLAIVRAIITLAGHLGINVVAEGIETAQQLAQLKMLHCEYGQGYFFARPLDSQAATALLLQNLTIDDGKNSD